MSTIRHATRCVWALLILHAALGAPVATGATLRHADNLVLPGAETIQDDLYGAGKIVDIQGTVDGDLFLAGQSVSISGTVTGDVFAMAREVTVTGRIHGSLRAAGNNITVQGVVDHDVVVGCGTLVIGPQAQVGRDVLAGAGNSSLGGRIGRDVRVGSGSATFSGSVGGVVRARAKSVHLADGAVLEKDLLYTSRNELTRANGARVAGRVERSVPPEQARGGGVGKAIWKWIQGLIGLLILALLFRLLFPTAGPRAAEAMGRSPLASLGIGILLAFGTPCAALFLFLVGILIGGWWIAPGVLVLYLFALALGYAIAAAFVGDRLLAGAGRAAPAFVASLLVGLALLGLVTAIPFLGWLVGWMAAVFGLGALALAWYRNRRVPRPVAAPISGVSTVSGP